MEPKSQLTEDEEYLNSLTEEEKKQRAEDAEYFSSLTKEEQIAVLHILAHAPYIKSSRNNKDKI